MTLIFWPNTPVKYGPRSCYSYVRERTAFIDRLYYLPSSQSKIPSHIKRGDRQVRKSLLRTCGMTSFWYGGEDSAKCLILFRRRLLTVTLSVYFVCLFFSTHLRLGFLRLAPCSQKINGQTCSLQLSDSDSLNTC